MLQLNACIFFKVTRFHCSSEVVYFLYMYDTAIKSINQMHASTPDVLLWRLDHRCRNSVLRSIEDICSTGTTNHLALHCTFHVFIERLTVD